MINCKKTIIVFFVCIAFFALAGSAKAATVNYYVDPTGTDDGSHGAGTGTDAWATIQYAISNVSNPTTDTIIINIAAGTYTNTDDATLTDDHININRGFVNLTLRGAGIGNTIIKPHADANLAASRVFYIDYEGLVTFEDMTIQDGKYSGSGPGIYSAGGDLTIRRCYIYDNYASGSGNSGGVYAFGTNKTITVEDSTFASNYGVYVSALSLGGTINKVTNSTFLNNTGASWGQVSTGCSNTSILTNITIIGGQGGVGNYCSTSITYMKNSIIANQSSGTGLDMDGRTFYNGGYNIVETHDVGATLTGDSTSLTGNQVNLNINESLSSNGSTNNTLTLALRTGSVAIDAGGSAAHGPVGNQVTPPATDERGKSRYNTIYDIGAFEYQGSDEADPLFSSASIASDDSYIDVTFDEAVYSTNSGSGGLAASDFSINVTTGYGQVTAASVTSVKALDGTNPSGGETTLRLYISLTGTKRGVETLTLSPANSSSIYDAAGNAMYQYNYSNSVTLSGAYEYYVDPAGTNELTSHGTSTGAFAWSTIQYAVSNVSNPTLVPIIINISGDTYTLNNDDVYIARNFINLTLRGDSASTTIIQAHSDPASASSRNFEVDYSENVTFEDMTIRYGNASYSGGIYTNGSGLTLRRCYIYDNNSTGMSYGGGFWNSRGDVVIEDSTFDANTGTYISGAYISGDSLIIKNSTFFNNTGDTYGSLYLHGFTDDLYIFNSIFTKGNNVEIQGSFDTYVRNSIFIDNSGPDIEYYYYYGDLIAENTIIGQEYNSYSSPGVPHIANGVNGNLVYTTNTTLANLNISDVLDMNSSANGVKTLALQTGSPAINSGAAATVGSYSTPNLDQRGASRISSMDIGPYEYDGVVGSPYITQYYPADNSTAVAVNSNLALYFSEAVDTEAGADNDVIIKKARDNSTIETIDAQDAKVTGSGTSVITINPAATLLEKTEYYVLVGTDAFDDVSSNSYSGISSVTTWTFTTADVTSPSVIYLNPADNSTGVSETANFEIAFNEAIATSTGNVYLYKTSDDSLVETIDIAGTKITASSTTALIINPATILGSNTGYYFTIDATTIDDTSGNSYAGITASTTWSFTTGDTINPTVLYLSPADNATSVGVDATFEIAFSEAIATSTGNVYLYKTSDNSLIETIDVAGSKITASSTTALIINPSTTLASETGYYFTIAATAIDDTSGNSYAGISASTTWSFTTADADAPTVIYFNPADNATSVGVDANFEIAFNEVIATSTGNIILYKTSDDSVVETINIASSTITASGTMALIINPSTTLASETGYYFTIDVTAIDDATGNSYAGITTSTTWSFTTVDIIDPIVSTLSPADNATNVSTLSNLVITFTEAVDAESGNISIYKTSDDSLVEAFNVTSDISGSGTTEITVNPTADFNYETEYYVLIDATAFDDATGNSYTGITASITWSFTTADTPVCPTIANAATYNSYPTCGVATCNSGYTLTAGACVSSGGNVTPTPPPAVGTGKIDTVIPMGNSAQVGEVSTQGVNVLSYVNSAANFSAIVSNYNNYVPQNHAIHIISLDLFHNIITLKIQSEPKIVVLNLDEEKNIDLDNDNINDIYIKFEDVFINRAELTIKSLLDQLKTKEAEAVMQNNQLIKYPDSSKVYLIENNKKRWIFDEETFNYFKYSWDDILIIDNNQIYSDGPIVIIPEKENNNFKFTRDLKLGMTGADVKQLQIYLNNNGFTVATTGYGSRGNETEVFGPATRAALIKFQISKNIYPAVGYFGSVTRGAIK